eukprot:gene2466-13446_t
MLPAAAAAPLVFAGYVRSNPLKDLAPLPKVHHSWPLPFAYLNNSDPGYLDGVVHDYVRITGSCPISLVADSRVGTAAVSCARICKA